MTNQNLSMAQRIAMLSEAEQEAAMAGIDPVALLSDWHF